MPRVLFCTFGSRGDLHPYVAIALALREHGVDATIATGEEHRVIVERAGGGGIEFVSIPPSRAEFEIDPGMMTRIMDEKTGGEVIFREIVLPTLDRTHKATLEAARGCDLIVGHPLSLTAPIVAEQLGIPYVFTALQPLCLFSAIDPPVLAPARALHALRHLGPWAIRVVYALMRLHLKSWGEPVNELRTRLGLACSKKNPILKGLHSRLLNLALFSPIIAPPQSDWPAHSIAVGACLFDDPLASIESERISRFLANDERPLVITLGSSAVEIGATIFEAAASAAKRMNRRCLLLTGPLPVPGACDDDRVIAAPYAPYSQVFPRAAAILHQCGAGTTAEAMRAGVPQVCVPFGHDQPDNAMRLRRLGVATTLDRKRIDATKIVRAFETLLDPRAGYIERARRVGELARAENGAQRAAQELVRVLCTK